MIFLFSTEVNIKCMCHGSWLTGSANLAYKYSGDKLKPLKDLVQDMVLPAGAYVRNIIFDSVTFVVSVTDLNALEELWKRYVFFHLIVRSFNHSAIIPAMCSIGLSSTI